MYEQNLVKIIEPVKINTIKRLNKKNKWELINTNKTYFVNSKLFKINK